MVVISAAIRPKRSEQSGSRPNASQILVGELATNLADKRIYSKTSAGDVIMVGDGGGVRTGSDGPDVPVLLMVRMMGIPMCRSAAGPIRR